MQVTFYPDEDAIYFTLSDEPFAYGKDLRDKTHLNFSVDGEVIGVEFLSISDGVDLSDIPEKVKYAISPVLEERGVKLYA